MPRVLVVDDHVVARKGFAEVCQGLGDCVLGEAATLAEGQAQLEAAAWDLLIVDLTLPDGNALIFLQAVRQRWPALSTMVLSLDPVAYDLTPLQRLGIRGFVSKRVSIEELRHAIKTLLAGGTYYSNDLRDSAPCSHTRDTNGYSTG